MRALRTITCLTMLLGPASAAERREDYIAPGRPDAYAMTCQAAQSYVAGRGATILETSRTTYDRYVRDNSFCYPTQTTLPAFVPTRDSANCFVGYTCEERKNWFED
jgi:hypothetical protein